MMMGMTKKAMMIMLMMTEIEREKKILKMKCLRGSVAMKWSGI